MKRAGLIGDPVEHSLSPHMHNAAFATLGLDITYELYQTTLAELPDRVKSLRTPEVIGVNVTVPHKQNLIPLCDEITETARRIGAVNTLIPIEGAGFRGDNTDAWGFIRSLQDAIPAIPNQALLLGSGGAARAVAVALLEKGVTSLTIANRTLDKAESLARELIDGGLQGVEAIASESIDAVLPSAELVINATSLGWHGDECPLTADQIAALSETSAVVDLTYRETALLRLAKDRGLVAIDGLGMLLYQGARALELWLGIKPPVDVMRKALIAEQTCRAG